MQNTQKTVLIGNTVTVTGVIIDDYPVNRKYPNTRVATETFSTLDNLDCLVVYSLHAQNADYPYRITHLSPVSGPSGNIAGIRYEKLCEIEIEKIDKKGLLFLKFLELNPLNSKISHLNADEVKKFKEALFTEIFQKIVRIYSSDIFYNKILDDPINFNHYNYLKIFDADEHDQFYTERAIYWILNEYLKSVNAFSKYMDVQVSQDYSKIFELMKYRKTMRGMSIYALHFVHNYSSWISKPNAEYYTKVFTDIGMVIDTFYDEANEKYSIIKTERMLSIQMALALLEIIIIFYYSLGIWHYLTDENTWSQIPVLFKAVIGMGFAILLTYGSHLVVSKENHYKKPVLCAIGIIILGIAAYFLTYEQFFLSWIYHILFP